MVMIFCLSLVKKKAEDCFEGLLGQRTYMLHQWTSCLCWSSLCYLINIVLFAECVKNDVDLV